MLAPSSVTAVGDEAVSGGVWPAPGPGDLVRGPMTGSEACRHVEARLGQVDGSPSHAHLRRGWRALRLFAITAVSTVLGAASAICVLALVARPFAFQNPELTAANRAGLALLVVPVLAFCCLASAVVAAAVGGHRGWFWSVVVSQGCAACAAGVISILLLVA